MYVVECIRRVFNMLHTHIFGKKYLVLSAAWHFFFLNYSSQTQSIYLVHYIKKNKMVHLLSKCKRMETSGKELNAGQHIFEWLIFTQKGVCLWIIQSKELTKEVITHFRVFYHSKMCCPAFNSLKEWKVTRLHLESGWF